MQLASKAKLLALRPELGLLDRAWHELYLQGGFIENSDIEHSRQDLIPIDVYCERHPMVWPCSKGRVSTPGTEFLPDVVVIVPRSPKQETPGVRARESIE